MPAPTQTSMAFKYTTIVWVLGQDDTGGAASSVAQYPDKTVQLLGTFSGGTVTIQGSMNGTDWLTLTDMDGDPLAITAAGMFVIRENPQYVRAISSDTASLDVTVILGAAERIG